MESTAVKDKQVDNSNPQGKHTSPTNSLLVWLRRLITHEAEVDSSVKSDQPRSGRLLKLKRTAENIADTEQNLIRQIGNAAETTDRATDKLIIQLQIQTNRLMAQLNELCEEDKNSKENV